MTVNSVDYAKGLAETRDNYRKASRENKANAQKEVDHLEKTFDYKSKKAEDNYLKARAKDEQDYERSVANIGQEAKEILEQSKEKFREEVQDERNRFQKEAHDTKEKFRKSLDELTHNFERAFDHERADHQRIQDVAKSKYLEASKNQSSNFDQSVRELDQRSKDEIDQIRQDQIQDRKDLIKDFNNVTHDIRKDGTTRLLQEVGKKDDQIENLRVNSERERGNLLEHHDKTRENDRRLFNENLVEQQVVFDESNKQMEKEKLEDKKATKDWFKGRVDELERKNYLNQEGLQKRIAAIQDDKNKIEEKLRKGTIEERRLGQKLENFKKGVERSKKEAQTENELAHQRSLETSNLEKARKAEDLERFKHEIHELSEDGLAKHHEDKLKLARHYQESRTIDQNHFQHQVNDLEKRSDESLRRETERWNNRVKDMSERNQEAISTLKEFYGERTKEMGLKHMEEKNKMAKGMNKEFQAKLNRTSKGYEDRLFYQERRANEDVEMLESRLRQLDNHRKREIKHRDQLVREQFEENEEVKKDLLYHQDLKFQSRIDETHRMYEEKIKDLVDAQDKKMKLMIEKYEDRIDHLSTDILRNQQKIISSNRRDLAGLKNDHEMTLKNLKTIYEDKIARMRENYEHRIEKIKNKKD